MESSAGAVLLERAAWPPRASVRGLAPVGVGTGWVESASGLLVRTAAANRLAVRPFLERVLGEVAGELAGGSPARTANLARVVVRSRSSAAINGSGVTARAWTGLLAAATLQQGLEVTTLIPWVGRFSNRGALRDHRAFCPVCLWDWARGGGPLGSGPAWEPLRWQVCALKACVIHEVRLTEQCCTPACGRTRAVIAGWASVERCVGCRVAFARPAELVRPLQAALSPDELDWARFVDAEVSDLLARGPDRKIGVAPFAAFLNIAMESSTGGAQREFARRIGMTEASVSYWKDRRRTPTLEAILRVCRVAGFRLRDVLTGDIEASRRSPAPEGMPYVAPSTETHTVRDQGHMEQVLEAALIAEPPPTLAAVCVDVRVDRSHLRRRYPRLCTAIRERRKAWDAAQRSAVYAERSARIRAEVSRLASRGIYPSRNQVHKALPGVWLRRPEFAAVWSESVVQAGWGNPS